MFCPNCGNEMSDSAAFCTNCGWSKNQTKRRYSFSIGDLKNKLGAMPIFVVAGLVVLFIIFKVVTSFSDVGSFAKEMKIVEKQLKNGDYASVFRNNIDYTGSDTNAEDLIRELNNTSGYGGISVGVITSFMKGSDLEKKLEKVYKEASKAIALKYSVKKVDKGKLRLTVKFNLPRPAVLTNNKISDKLSQLVIQLRSVASGNMLYSGDYMSIISQFSNFDKPAIDILKTYKSLGKDVKQDFDIYIDFYKIDGHWKYKLVEGYADATRIQGAYNGWSNEWSNAYSIIESFISKYNLDF